MKVLLFLVLICSSISAFSREIPILDPSDSEFVWMDQLIENDFQKAPARITWEEYQRHLILHRDNSWIVRFRIINNRVEGPPGPCFNMLNYLCQTYGLPSLDFLYWNQDGPWSSIAGTIPVFVGARRTGANQTILFGDWLFDIQNPNGPWNRELKEIDAAYSACLWPQKINKLFWRGVATDMWSGGPYSVENWAQHARGKPCALSLEFPELIDAAFTGFLPFLCAGGGSEAARLSLTAPMSSFVSLTDQLKYKYLLQVTGLMANFPRDRWQFYSGCVVFRHPHPHEMYWYPLIKPWTHYIPVQSSMEDLVAQIKWALQHDEECRQIADRARQFAESHFMPEHIALYCYKVLKRYAAIQSFNPQ